jgi:hypothetical protein
VGDLRNASVWWLWKAYQGLNKLEIVKKVRIISCVSVKTHMLPGIRTLCHPEVESEFQGVEIICNARRDKKPAR